MRAVFLASDSIPVTRYQETFNRADQPFFLGNNWNFQVTDATTQAPSAMAGGINVAAGAATIGAGGVTTTRCLFTPAFVNRPAITSSMLVRGQYAQFTVTGVAAGVSNSVGPMVYNPNPNDGNCYAMILQSNGQTVDLFRGVGGAAAPLVTNAFAFIVNDIVRIEVTPGAADNTIRLFKNGVLGNTFVDNNALRPTGGGHYGIAWFSSNAGTLSFKDFDGGLL